MKTSAVPRWVLPMGLIILLSSFTDNLTLGIGRYPGAPAENFAPSLVADTTYRNIALHRPAWTSSTYDFNLTAQLLTDGIVAKTSPRWLSVTTNAGQLPTREQEWTLDSDPFSGNIVVGEKAFLQYDWHGQCLKANRVRLTFQVAYDEEKAQGGYEIRLLTGQKRQHVVASKQGHDLPGTRLRYKVHSDPNKVTKEGTLPVRAVEVELSLKDVPSFSRLRLELSMPGAAYWMVKEMKFFQDEMPVTELLPSFDFESAWRSNGGGEQWAYVDLGRHATFDHVRLSWIEKPGQGCLQTSADARSWTTIATLPKHKNNTDEITFAPTTGRYVRVLMQQTGKKQCYVLSEIEVMGRGGLAVKPHERSLPDASQYMLSGGNWRLQRASEVTASGEEISRPDFDATRWIVATVPATVLTSYVNIGALPDPNIAGNLFQASESFFNANFWYRTEFSVPTEWQGKHVLLNFDGINWKANIYLNGQRIDRIEGAFLRGQTDVTSLLRDDCNVLAIEIERTAHPGAVKEKTNERTGFNGGILGQDNPTFHATIGWDWISTLRGRDIGLWNDVFLSTTDAVSLRDGLVSTQLALPDTLATITPSVFLHNRESHTVRGTLRGHVGTICFEQPIDLQAGEEREVLFSPDDFPTLRNQRLNLWWPNGYGSPFLYEAGFDFVQDGHVTDSLRFKTGIRQMTYEHVNTRLTMYVNGRRFIPLGGNWGFSENNLNYRRREYDIAVSNHRDMNFNMIRNWVGQTADEEFYDACDEQGIMVWQDFWLANPSDGPDPDDEPMFLRNAIDFTSRMRHHPCIGIYCGRNEGYPPKTLDEQLRQIVDNLNPGLAYISSSADEGVSGHGPYWALPSKEYFDRQTGKLHTERGMPNVMTYEGLCRTIDPERLWPQGDAYGQHDFTQAGAQRGATFNAILSKAFGSIDTAERFAQLAQWENYEGYRAMFESDSRYRQGLLIWMSHACWPSLTWQCYDYYFEPTAAYFACKKACEPLHIQWNALTGNVEVVNRSAGRHESLQAIRSVVDLQGHVVLHDSTQLTCADDTTVVLSSLAVPATFRAGEDSVCFLKLSLTDADGHEASNNLYVLAAEEGNLRQLNTLSTVTLQATATQKGERFDVTLKNVSNTPALMVRINLKANDGDQILPVSYTDNFFHLLPGEERTVTVAWQQADARNQKAEVELSGFNVPKQILH